MQHCVLLVEETESLRDICASALKAAGFGVCTSNTLSDAVSVFSRYRPNVVLLDVTLGASGGLDLMDQCRQIKRDTRFIAVTPNRDMNKAVAAMRAGAYDFLLKPFNTNRLIGAVENAVTDRLLEEQTGSTLVPRAQIGLGEMLGASDAIETVFAKIRSVAGSKATVFLSGESGTGKELCAQALHDQSNRAEGAFVPLDCASIPPDKLESEVFGHLKGSFTGAITDKQGAAATADGGTLFLDEVCEMDLQMQTKLLRFIQTSTIQPVGAIRPQQVNVRIVCATNRDPLAEVKAGRFREDLFYRLHVVPIHIPPLRERKGDAVLIAQHALRRFARAENKVFYGLAHEVSELFERLTWPGNVRQLLNTIQNTVVLHDGPIVTMEMLHLDNNDEQTPRTAPVKPTHVEPNQAIGALAHMNLDEIERLLIEHRIAACKGSIPRAAQSLGVSPSTIYRKRDAWEKA